MSNRFLTTVALMLALAFPTLAQPQQQAQPTPQQGLVLGQSQLQQASMRLQRAKDTGERLGRPQIDETRQTVDSGIGTIEAAFKELLAAKPSDEAQQAMRNARLRMQSAKEAMRTLEPDAPEHAIQALKDTAQAVTEVQETAQLAAQPPR